MEASSTHGSTLQRRGRFRWRRCRGIFDFNKAPFFQSFVEVQVKPQLNEVRLLLHGVNGLLTWGDLDRSGKLATEHSPADSVIITLPLQQR